MNVRSRSELRVTSALLSWLKYTRLQNSSLVRMILILCPSKGRIHKERFMDIEIQIIQEVLFLLGDDAW
jgi:hypothetical protein